MILSVKHLCMKHGQQRACGGGSSGYDQQSLRVRSLQKGVNCAVPSIRRLPWHQAAGSPAPSPRLCLPSPSSAAVPPCHALCSDGDKTATNFSHEFEQRVGSRDSQAKPSSQRPAVVLRAQIGLASALPLSGHWVDRHSTLLILQQRCPVRSMHGLHASETNPSASRWAWIPILILDGRSGNVHRNFTRTMLCVLASAASRRHALQHHGHLNLVPLLRGSSAAQPSLGLASASKNNRASRAAVR